MAKSGKSHHCAQKSIIYSKMHTANIQMLHACVKPESSIQGRYRPKVHAQEYPIIGSLRQLSLLCCAFGFLGHLAPFHWCAHSVCCVVLSASLASWLLFTGVHARCVVLPVRCPWPLALVHRCARVVCSVWCAAACCAFVPLLWLSPAPDVLARPTRFWCGLSPFGWLRLLGTWFCALVVAGGVPLWRASWPSVGAPCLVRSDRSWYVDRLPGRRGDIPNPGAHAPGFTRWLHGARGRRPRTGLMVAAAGPRRGRGAWLAPPCTRSGPRDGVVPGGYPRRRSWVACIAVVLRVLTQSPTRMVSRTVRLFSGDSAGALALFSGDANTFPCGSEDAKPGSARVCVCGCVRASLRGAHSSIRTAAVL